MNNKFLAVIISLLLLALIIMMCRDVSEVPDITPTLAISETPSITPMPPTATPSPVVTVSGSPPPAGETAVVPSPPPAAVSPTSTPTPLPVAPTRTPTPTPLPLYVVKPGDCLACLSYDWYGSQARWGDIWRANGMFARPHEIFPGQELIRPE